MDLSERCKHTSPASCKLSPCGRYVANLFQHRVVVRDVETLKLVRQWSSTDHLREVHWSPDSELLLTVTAKTELVQVWRLEDAKWNASVDESFAGVTRVAWSPDSRHILCFSDLQLRLTIWSLVSKEAYYIKYPKNRDRSLSFHRDHRYMALAERKEVKDHVGIYNCDTWSLVHTFPVETLDLEGLQWSPNGRYIAVWDTMLEYKVLVYTPDGHLQKSYSAYSNGLGVRTMAWSPSSQFLAVGSYDQKARLLNHFTWTPLIELEHPARQLQGEDTPVCKCLCAHSWPSSCSCRYADEMARGPLQLQTVRPDPDRPNPRMGINLLDFDAAGGFIVTRNENMPNYLWIWEVAQLSRRALIQQAMPVRTARWNPVLPGILAYCCGTRMVYLWTEKHGCRALDLPHANFVANGLRWSPNGRSLLLVDKEIYTLARLHDDVLGLA
ncbi:hypothetical protein THASP1DRAFT_18862 [Thamnocephalis sphaerospora]|uniref:Uncharacterized protein n=1 Tax=Thamnocephalis sphaerospora TaxID=78915 RepID=A0A4P9XK19_9FUNG|nr:hypothetical protein THASP1DRAFT_18862 [Thamnocephalis sphaerospora]|eukprot:RKP06138.1 hypothetical protein THASP1DRAFT_18862 [Thamnocephalis sphaerospora]